MSEELTLTADEAPRVAGTITRISRLVALYVAQGIPFGFGAIYIPLQLAERRDFKYSQATLFMLAQTPWLLKMLWAPAADAHYWPRIGRRRSWIIPAQVLLVLTSLAAVGLNFNGPLAPIFVVVTMLSLWSSVQDTAVDGLAIDMLPEKERGLGNSAQVGGYKIGMIFGGSGLAVIAAHYGTRWAMAAMACAIAVLLFAALLYREPPPPPKAAAIEGSSLHALEKLWSDLVRQGWLPTLFFIATVKIGETMVGALMKPFLVRELHYSVDRASVVMGVIGLGFSLAGSVIGGIISGRWGRVRSLATFAILQGLVLAALGLALKAGVHGDGLVALIAVEHFVAGLLTPALYAYMMDITDTAIAATHYTLLSTVELVAKGTGGALAGPLADFVGVSSFILWAGILGAIPLILLPLLRRPANMAAAPAYSA